MSDTLTAPAELDEFDDEPTIDPRVRATLERFSTVAAAHKAMVEAEAAHREASLRYRRTVQQLAGGWPGSQRELARMIGMSEANLRDLLKPIRRKR